MGRKSSENYLLAQRYAAAVLDMAGESGLADKLEKDFSDLRAMIDASADLRTLAGSPLMSRNAQKRGILALAQAAGFQALTAGFLGVLADNRRLSALPQILDAFADELRRRRGVVEAKVESAFPLAPAQVKALQEALGRAMGAGVALDLSVNKDLLGGMVVTVGSRMYDDSVRRKLDRLQRAMSSQANQGVSFKEVG